MPEMIKKLIAIDPQTRIKLKELGKNLRSPKSKQIINTLPILKDATCGIDKPSARNLELLRQFSQFARPNITLWASAHIDEAGQIQSIDTAANIELAHALLKNPNRMMAEINKSLDIYSTKLPREWQNPALDGGTVGLHLVDMNLKLNDVSSPDTAAEEVGPDLSHFLFDVILMLKMITAAQEEGPEKKNARLFLSDFVKYEVVYLNSMSRHFHKFSLAEQHGLYIHFSLLDQANKVLGGRPLTFSIPPPTTITSAVK